MEFAGLLGWKMWNTRQPVDWLGALFTKEDTVFRPIEIKTQSGRLTPRQRKFIAEVASVAGEVLIWRDEEDIRRDTLAIRGY